MPSKYTISHAKRDDLNGIMSFLKEVWRKNHILSRDKTLFKYEFEDQNKLNFVVAKDLLGKIIGCIGYVKSNFSSNPDIWTSIWGVSKNRSDNLLGIKLFIYLQKKIPHRYMIAAGVNPKTLVFYEKFGIKTGILKQHFILNKFIKYNDMIIK